MGRTAKLTVTLPQELIAAADRIAKEKKISRSKVISNCLQEMAERQKAVEMAEGYIKMADEQKRLADLAATSIPEVIPEWK